MTPALLEFNARRRESRLLVVPCLKDLIPTCDRDAAFLAIRKARTELLALGLSMESEQERMALGREILAVSEELDQVRRLVLGAVED